MKRALFALMIILCAVAPAIAVNPDEILSDAGLEARARELSKGLRCVVCRNQSIDDSNAGIARDMRIVLRERLVAGDTDAEAMAYLVDRYSEFVLLRPPVKPVTYLLWGGPALLLFLAVFGFSGLWRRTTVSAPDDATISPQERELLDALLEEDTERR